MEEIPDEDATPKCISLSDEEEEIFVAIEELPNQYEELPALVYKEDKKLPEGDLLITYPQGEPVVMVYRQENKELLNQLIHITDPDVLLRATTSLSKSCA